ncbi:MAG: transposase [Desulfurococcaceae archaeon]
MSLLESRNIPISWENGKNWTYNKKGNKWLRRMLVQCAMVAIKTRKSQIKQFYLRIRGRRGRRTAIVATARKLLGIIWHLLKTGEEYIDKHYVKKTLKKSRKKNTQTSSGRSNTAT